MIFTHKLVKTLSGLALALAFSNAAHASTVEYNYNYSSGNDVITANFFVDDSTDPNNNNISSGSYSVNGTSYSVAYGAFYLDAQIFTGTTGYIFQLITDNVNALTVDDFIGELDVAHDLTFTAINDTSFFGRGTLTKATSESATAVPEPEAYAMMLAGLGLVGFAARRNKQVA